MITYDKNIILLISITDWYFANVTATLCECFATTFDWSILIRERAGTAGRSMENERSFVDNPWRMYPTKRQTRQGRKRERGGKGREAAPGEQEITSPDVRSFGFRAPRHRSWEKPALFLGERDARENERKSYKRGRVHDRERDYERRIPRRAKKKRKKKRRANSASVNILSIRSVSKCTLGMRSVYGYVFADALSSRIQVEQSRTKSLSFTIVVDSHRCLIQIERRCL